MTAPRNVLGENPHSKHPDRGSLHVPALSDGWLDRIDAVAHGALGVNDLRGDRLVQALAATSHAYTKGRDALDALRGDDDALCARLKFYLPRDLLKVHGPLAELASVGALPERRAWRVLDLGAGLGTTGLGVARFAALSGCADRLHVDALDLDREALAIYEELARDLVQLPGVPIELEAREADLRLSPAALAHELAPPYDLIVMGLALNELRRSDLDETSAVELASTRLIELSGLLSVDGVLLVIEPALRETSRFLHAIRDRLSARGAAPYVFAPCVRARTCPMLARERDYCHERVPFQLPARLGALAESAGLRDAELTYSYLTLHAAKRSLRERHDSALYRAVSAPLPSKGKLELWLCGESAAPRAQRLDRHASPANQALEHAGRGALVRLGIPAEPDAERLRIGPETSVELVQAWDGPGPEP